MASSFFIQPPPRMGSRPSSALLTPRLGELTSSASSSLDIFDKAIIDVTHAAAHRNFSDVGANRYDLTTGSLTNTFRKGWIPTTAAEGLFPALDHPKYIDPNRPANDEKAFVLRKILPVLFGNAPGDSVIDPAVERLFISPEGGYGALYIFDRTPYHNFHTDRAFYPDTSAHHLSQILYLFPLKPVELGRGELVLPLFQFANWKKNSPVFKTVPKSAPAWLERLGTVMANTFMNLQLIQPGVLQQTHMESVEVHGDQHRQRLADAVARHHLGILWDSPLASPREFISVQQADNNPLSPLYFGLGAVSSRFELSSPYLPFKVAEFIEYTLRVHPDWSLDRIYAEVHNQIYSEHAQDNILVFLGQLTADFKLHYVSSLPTAFHIQPNAIPPASSLYTNASPFGKPTAGGPILTTVQLSPGDMIFIQGLGCAHTLGPTTEAYANTSFTDLFPENRPLFSTADEGASLLEKSIKRFSKKMPRTTDWTALFVPTPSNYQRTWRFNVPKVPGVYPRNLMSKINQAILSQQEPPQDINAIMTMIDDAIKTPRPLAQAIAEIRQELGRLIPSAALRREIFADIHNFLCHSLKSNIRDTITSMMKGFKFSKSHIFDFGTAFGEAMGNILDYGACQETSYVKCVITPTADGLMEVRVELFNYAKPQSQFRPRERDERGMGNSLMMGTCSVETWEGIGKRPWRRVEISLTNKEKKDSEAMDYSHLMTPEFLAMLEEFSKDKK